jgi:DNA adenine methylase
MLRGKDMNDTFFDDLYNEFNISRVEARRSINANADKRGALKELLITNFETNSESRICLKNSKFSYHN